MHRRKLAGKWRAGNSRHMRNPFLRGGEDIDFTSFSSGHKKTVNRWVFEFLMTYLFALHSKTLKHDDIEIIFLHSINNTGDITLRNPNIEYQNSNGLAVLEEEYLLAKVKFLGETYFVNLSTRREELEGILHSIITKGVSPNSSKAVDLEDILIKESIRNSIYKGKILKVLEAPYQRDDEDSINLKINIVDDLNKSDLSKVFLPNGTRKEMGKFIECVSRFSDINMNLRYLLSGLPGTGKTHLIRAVAKECENKATIILASGGDSRLNTLFSFANIFSPAILCIDDIDLIVGNRDTRSHDSSLGTLLQKLDGFIESGVFVLATTNDKKMVDIAASRPGRFDQIIDMGKLESKNYLALVESLTKDDEIRKLFGNIAVLSMLKKKNIVGAFLATLVKQAIITKKTNGKKGFSKSELLTMIKQYHTGFYQNPNEAFAGFYQNSDEGLDNFDEN
ncbi:MAG: ATP-binding protein [Elusimicrobiota bacterium]|nr:ATP-binding protein [Elusimicrobiota bacterium]